jgi:hypothetical protein
MITQQQLQQYLMQLQQKNNVGTGTVALPAQPTSQQGAQPQAAPQNGNNGFSLSGFVGGLGDTQNPDGSVSPSLISKLNQAIYGTQQAQLPWQQGQSQQSGQNLASGNNGIMSFLSSLLGG